MAQKRPLALYEGEIEEIRAGDTVPASIAPGSGGGGGPTITRHEIDFGTSPRDGAVFDITVTGVTAGQRVLAAVSLDMPAGVDADELEMDPLSLAAHAVAADTVRVIAASRDPIRGLRAINILR